MKITLTAACVGIVSLGHGIVVQCQTPVGLQNATATYSQTYMGDFSPAQAINGRVDDPVGWAIYDGGAFFGTTGPATAVFETKQNVGFSQGSFLTFDLHFSNWNPNHTLGRFRISVTTDDRAQFADGLASGGDVTANWSALTPVFFAADAATLSLLSDGSILANSFFAANDHYRVVAETALTGITGVRLEALEDPSLPTNGPGWQSQNGNFVLSEFEFSITPIPEPSMVVLGGLGAVLFAFRGLSGGQRRR